MADGADAHDAVPGFQMAPGVPGDGGDAVAELDAVALAGAARLSARGRGFRRNWCDGWGLRPIASRLLACRGTCRVLDNPVTKQRPILHQSTHTDVPPECVIACLCAAVHGIAMNFSAEKAARKWPCGGFGRTGRQWLPSPRCCCCSARRPSPRRGAKVAAGPGTLGRPVRRRAGRSAARAAVRRVGAAAEAASGRGARRAAGAREARGRTSKRPPRPTSRPSRPLRRARAAALGLPAGADRSDRDRAQHSRHPRPRRLRRRGSGAAGGGGAAGQAAGCR